MMRPCALNLKWKIFKMPNFDMNLYYGRYYYHFCHLMSLSASSPLSLAASEMDEYEAMYSINCQSYLDGKN